MIIEIPDDNSIVKWKNDEKDEWKVAEISDLIKAYERPQVTVFAENADEKTVEELKAELEQVINEARTQGEWIDRMADKGYVECPFCHKQITGGDLNFCVKCGADMRKGSTESLDYQRAVEDAEYCERYEPTYNPNDGSM